MNIKQMVSIAIMLLVIGYISMVVLLPNRYTSGLSERIYFPVIEMMADGIWQEYEPGTTFTHGGSSRFRVMMPADILETQKQLLVHAYANSFAINIDNLEYTCRLRYSDLPISLWEVNEFSNHSPEYIEVMVDTGSSDKLCVYTIAFGSSEALYNLMLEKSYPTPFVAIILLVVGVALTLVKSGADFGVHGFKQLGIVAISLSMLVLTGRNYALIIVYPNFEFWQICFMVSYLLLPVLMVTFSVRLMPDSFKFTFTVFLMVSSTILLVAIIFLMIDIALFMNSWYYFAMALFGVHVVTVGILLKLCYVNKLDIALVSLMNLIMLMYVVDDVVNRFNKGLLVSESMLHVGAVLFVGILLAADIVNVAFAYGDNDIGKKILQSANSTLTQTYKTLNRMATMRRISDLMQSLATNVMNVFDMPDSKCYTVLTKADGSVIGYGTETDNYFVTELFSGGDGKIELRSEQPIVVNKTSQMILDIMTKNIRVLLNKIQRYEQVSQMNVEIISQLGHLVEMRAGSPPNHAKRMIEVISLLADMLIFPESELNMLLTAVNMKDVGFFAIDDKVIGKEELTEEEQALIDSHVDRGHEMLKIYSTPMMDLAANIALYHHEHADGTGIKKMKMAALPASVRMVCAAFCVDDYLAPLIGSENFPSEEEYSEYITSQGGKWIDSLSSELLANAYPQIKEIYSFGLQVPDVVTTKLSKNG